MLTWAPELWPELAAQWYEAYERQYWQQRTMLAGYREFPPDAHEADWQMEVDAGPVIGGLGTAASAFGLAAARVNGRPGQAYPLSAEALAISWPLPNGTMLGPRMLSSASDAPYIGETALLFCLTRRPLAGSTVVSAGETPWVVCLGMLTCVAIGVWCVMSGVALIRRWRKADPSAAVSSDGFRVGVWLVLAIAGLSLSVYSNTPLGVPLVLLAPFLVQSRSKKTAAVIAAQLVQAPHTS